MVDSDTTTMNRLPPILDSGSWNDSISRLAIGLVRPFRRLLRARRYRIRDVDVRGAEPVRRLLDEGAGLLITPNHCNHADVMLIYDLADRLHCPFHIMAAAHVFANVTSLVRMILRWHGCFSVDRAGSDLRAFKRGVSILQESPHPLVIFPEGEVYHLNDALTPFRDGAAMIALRAARRADRPLYCVPCAIKYTYVEDPTPALLELMAELERRAHWRPRPERPLVERVLLFATGQLALKEIEYLGRPQDGTTRERLRHLREHILVGLETQYVLDPRKLDLPERIKSVRRACLDALQVEDTSASNGLEAEPTPEAESTGDETPAKSFERSQIENHLHDLFVVLQLYSYLGDYLEGEPAVERLAETLDKLEEDVLDVPFASVRGARRAVCTLGEPLDVSSFAGRSARKAAPGLTRELEIRVQALLDGL